MSTIFESARGALLVTFFKRRWLNDVVDLIEETFAREDGALAFDDVDMDNDMRELQRVSGPDALAELATIVLRDEIPSEPSLGIEALGPELEGDVGEVFLRLLAVNIAFRLRTPELLQDLARFSASDSAPFLAPENLGGLLARACLRAEAEALLSDALEGEDLEEAQAALRAGAGSLDLRGGRIHLRAEPEVLEKAIDRAMRPRERAGWTQGVGSPSRRRLLAHKQRGGWFTLLEEGDAPPLELASSLAATGGVTEVAWVHIDPELGEFDFRVLAGTRTISSTKLLGEQLASEVSAEDVAAYLRSRGVHDLDPGHARGVPQLRWSEAAGLDFKKKSIRSFCYL